MRTTIVIILFVTCLSGCGVSRVISNDSGQPLLIAESGYSTGGCIRTLKAKSNLLGVKIDNIIVDNSSQETMLRFFRWPFVKGTTCTADVDLQSKRENGKYSIYE